MKKLFLFLLILSSIHSEVAKEAQLLFKKALEFNALGDYPSALSKYIEAYNVDQGVLGLKDEGLLSNGTKYFRRYLRDNAGDINSLMWLASIATMKADYREAIEYYQKVVHLAPKTEEALEADKEILRLEQIIRGTQQAEEQRRVDENREVEDLDRIKTNVTRDIEAKYQKQLLDLNEKIEGLEKEKQTLAEQAQKAKEETEKLRDELSKLKEQDAHHRRLYLFYKRKSGGGSSSE